MGVQKEVARAFATISITLFLIEVAIGQQAYMMDAREELLKVAFQRIVVGKENSSFTLGCNIHL